MTTTYDRIVTVLENDFDIEKASLSPTTDVVADLGFDSLDFLDLSFKVEKEFQVKMAPEHFIQDKKVVTLYDISTYIDTERK